MAGNDPQASFGLLRTGHTNLGKQPFRKRYQRRIHARDNTRNTCEPAPSYVLFQGGHFVPRIEVRRLSGMEPIP